MMNIFARRAAFEEEGSAAAEGGESTDDGAAADDEGRSHSGDAVTPIGSGHAVLESFGGSGVVFGSIGRFGSLGGGGGGGGGGGSGGGGGGSISGEDTPKRALVEVTLLGAAPYPKRRLAGRLRKTVPGGAMV